MTAAPTGDPVAAQEWRDALNRVTELLTAATPDQLTRRVPACPEWTVHQLLSHMVGLDRDVLDDNEAPDHNIAWTQAQVRVRADRSTAAVLAEWAALADDMAAYLTMSDTRPLGDAIIHEHDLREALGQPGAEDNGGLVMVRQGLAGLLAGRLDDLAPVRLESDTWSWTSGDGDPGVVLTAGDADLLRALTSRRSPEQLRGWVTAGDVTPYLDALAIFGPLPENRSGSSSSD